ncbi:Hypothetical predicted protein [Cloeon dipterum]|uniref:Late endosomal/lysosomal adaptor and MAPK and MTOR activator 5 n=1 Tax=Cloeon dipterum TaxID=197152 RepID=A0A8S1D055_9INSE|nr:Hypothetical predicted protein [Cloeon dipterum]
MMQAADVKGVLLTDKTGMTLGLRGLGANLNAGGVDRLAKIAAKLDPSGRLPQVVAVEGESSHILIQQRPNFTGAVVKEVISAHIPSSSENTF